MTFLSIIWTADIQSQSPETIDTFLIRIDNCLSEFSKTTSNIYVSNGMHSRKVRLNGKFDNDTKKFKQRIKYCKGASKIEKIKIKYLAPKKALLVLKIVLIDNQYFYIKYNSYDEKYHKISEEQLIDSKIYIKLNRDEKASKYPSRLDIWNLKAN
jgi:hypothetical protein